MEAESAQIRLCTYAHLKNVKPQVKQVEIKHAASQVEDYQVGHKTEPCFTFSCEAYGEDVCLNTLPFKDPMRRIRAKQIKIRIQTRKKLIAIFCDIV